MAQPRKTPRRARVRTAAAEEEQASQTPAATPVVTAPQAAPTHINLLQLGSSLSIREVSECASQLKTMLSNGPTNIDASKLESIDTAGIQLLLVAAASAQRRGFKLKLIGAHGLQTGAARSLGLHEHLGELAQILP
jgi:anti-anti-sigma regulatory factor